ncbi:MAG: nicotinate-nucleotide diphosphorylase (carboxylating) [Deltaproteobacteria bacterium CG_4_10_14_0_2_um_filter_43_8]|nr:MAG: nicotinate-nucleotide diphosphorylase (carboxylating) [Deltaproteobacteria bacterium CG11_big_fil_rev_8_21_14_0_20_42_23]PJA20279.1 MAG: nicotinate-nucleotide diphosphorylase (carboxylating) [Deltaproteobacteria bacterium CG_4_10_14_0_2_um_filter_43_8]PJC64062.1 MAG: nicotinate-nucleotide diphosphorylase (carboxylating) [Deltaproteobacteria bacterium CG_4_9_14_0_2_um_filter_42_21]
MKNVNTLIDLALREDIGSGDITSEAIVSERMRGRAMLRAKQDLVVAGLEVAKEVFLACDEDIHFAPEVRDGQRVQAGTVLANVIGNLRQLLVAERTALNFLQHLCGVATHTHRYVQAIEGTNAKILDTRKTLPAYRELEKYAVSMGDGENHRHGLFDRYLIKGNHVDIAGDIESAIMRAQAHQENGILIEVECKTLADVKTAFEAGVDIIMLDNMSVAKVKEAATLIQGRVKLEVSGNITLDTVKEYAATGVDYISVGAITHSVPAADIHMVISKDETAF